MIKRSKEEKGREKEKNVDVLMVPSGQVTKSDKKKMRGREKCRRNWSEEMKEEDKRKKRKRK